MGRSVRHRAADGAGAQHVAHPGPLHFYLMALPVRLLGPALGMLTVSLAVVAAARLITAWVVFRQLGPAGGAVRAVALGLVTFTTGLWRKRPGNAGPRSSGPAPSSATSTTAAAERPASFWRHWATYTVLAASRMSPPAERR